MNKTPIVLGKHPFFPSNYQELPAMSIEGMTAILSLTLALITNLVLAARWAERTRQKAYAAQRDFEALSDDYARLAAKTDRIADDTNALKVGQARLEALIIERMNL